MISYQPIRQMATLKDISVRLKSIKNIQKITSSMKMVSAAKFSKAEKELKPARPYGQGAKSFYTSADLTDKETPAKPNLIVAVTSDRGLCGAANSSIAKAIKEYIATSGNTDVKLVLIGDKSRGMLSRNFKDQFLLSVSDVGKKPPTFADASKIAQAIMDHDFKFNEAHMFYNVFKSVIAYKTTVQPLFSVEKLLGSPNLALFDDLDEDMTRCYNEYILSSLIFYAMKEASCSEQSARMTAMDSATKNAGEMIGKLQLTFNRTRQAVITKELNEIISGAAAV